MLFSIAESLREAFLDHPMFTVLISRKNSVVRLLAIRSIEKSQRSSNHLFAGFPRPMPYPEKTPNKAPEPTP
jgi:hypothetical protein